MASQIQPSSTEGDPGPVVEGTKTPVEAVSASSIVPDLVPVMGEVSALAASAQSEFTGSDAGETIVANGSDNIIDALGGDDAVQPLAGADLITLGDGADTIMAASMAELAGDIVTDFTGEDQILMTGRLFGRGDIAVSNGTTLAIDEDRDGVWDGALLLEGNFSGGDFMAVRSGGDTLVTFESFLPKLQDGKAVNSGLVNGILNPGFLNGDASTDFRVTLRDLGVAGYDNVLGAYEIDGAGNIVDVRILFANANRDNTASVLIENVEAGHGLGFFIVQDAADWAAALKTADRLSFVDGSGGAANVSDGTDISIAVNGAAVDEMVFHSFSRAMNPDGLQHVLSGVDPGGAAITVGFEDLTGGGDRDYEDVVFRIEHVDAFVLL